MGSDKRKRSRVDTQIGAVVSCGVEKYPVQVRNVSLKGMLCEPEPRLTGNGKGCVVIFKLSEALSFRVEARLVRNEPGGMALDFEGMDEQAFFHLRNLVRYHSLDPDAIDKEMAVPAFGKARR